MRAALPLLAAGLLLCASTARTQEIAEFDKLRTPASPALVLLGVAPAKIQRPNVPATVAASLVEAFGAGGSNVPNGYAIEVAPYWLVPHPTLTLRNYAQNPASFARTFTVSLASADSTVGDDALASSRLAFGVRGMLISSAEKLATDTLCIGRAEAAGAFIAQGVGAIIAAFVAANPGATADRIEAERSKAMDSVLRQAPDSIQEVVSEEFEEGCIDLFSVNRGFTLDVAGGGAWAFRDGAWENGTMSRAGVWLTPAFKWSQHGDMVGVASIHWQGLDSDSTSRVIDLGVRAIYAWNRFAISAETIYRNLGGDVSGDDLWRVDVGLDVELRDGLWLTSTFGRDFNARDARSLLAIANLQWNIGDRSIQPVTR